MSSLDDKYNNMTLKEAVEAYQKEEQEKQFQEAKSQEAESQNVKVKLHQNEESNGGKREFKEQDLLSSDEQKLNIDIKKISETHDKKISEKDMPDVKISEKDMPDIKIPDIDMLDIKIPDIKISDERVPDSKNRNAKISVERVIDPKSRDIKTSVEGISNSKNRNAKIPDERVIDPKSRNIKTSVEGISNSNNRDAKISSKRASDSQAGNIQRRRKMSGFEKFAEVGKWFQTICWIKIPIIGFLYIIVLAISKRTPSDKKYFVLGYLMYKILVWVLAFVLIYCLYKIGLDLIDDMLSLVKN